MSLPAVSAAHQEIFGALSLALMLLSYAPYMRALLRHEIQPHVFTWIIWALTALTVFLSGTAGGGGAGMWGMLVCLLCNLFIALRALRYAKMVIAPLDWLALGACLAAYPLWLLTDDPAPAMLIATLIDALAYIPTLRKTWQRPQSENMAAYAISLPAYGAALMAMPIISPATASFAIMCLVFNSGMCGLMLWRRRQMRGSIIRIGN